MGASPITLPALLALALKSARCAPGLDEAMAAYDRGDYIEAESLLVVAGHGGHPNAQELLGFIYAIGPDLYPGVERRLESSRRWFERAARGGRPAAQWMHSAFARRGVSQVFADIKDSFSGSP